LFTVGFFEDLVVGGLGPDEGVGSVVPAGDVGADLGVEVFDGAEGSPVDGLAFDQENQTSTRFIHDAWVGVKWLRTMGRLAGMAEVHYQQWMPRAYRRIKNKPQFFEDLENEAQEQIEALAESLRGENPATETFEQKMGRYATARRDAEYQVIREVIVPPPPEPETTADEAMPEPEWAVVYEALAEANAALDRVWESAAERPPWPTSDQASG